MQTERLWQTVLGEVEIGLSRASYLTWFKNSQLVSVDGDNVVIGAPNIFIKQQLEGKYNDLISKTLQKNGLTSPKISYKILPAQPQTKAPEIPVEVLAPQPRPVHSPTAATPPPIPSTSPLSHTYRQGINERYTFDTFIVGAANELAYAACQAIAAEPGTKYNPLFLYGGAGIGKTHLIQAVGNAVLASKPGARVVYVTSEQFVQEFVDALRFKKNTAFADHYRSADVLIVDDVQFLAGKEKIQEEFFHTFNALHQANHQIILSSDKPPGEIQTLEDRLKSRFVWGMSIDMQNPDFETRCAILQSKAESHGVHLPTDVVEYLATNIQTNIRELEGALNQLLAFCEMRALEPNLAIATGLLGASHSRPKHLSAKQIIERCAKHYQVPIEDIMSPKRDKDIVLPRQVAMYLLRSELHLSFPKIAHELSRKDHTTAMHSVEKIEQDMQLDPDLRSSIQEIKERLYA
jgi:chromosomal replication initiator protein